MYILSLQELIIVCCLCFSHIPRVKREKLDKKVELGVFIGYCTISNVYTDFQPHTKNIMVSRDVFFMENK